VAKDRKAAHAQLIGNLARISGCCRDGCAGMRSRPSITGSVKADPTDTQVTRGLEKWLGRSTRVGGAVMPQDDQLVGVSRGTDGVRVKAPPIGGEKVNLNHLSYSY
jgi:hypothetical protein